MNPPPGSRNRVALVTGAAGTLGSALVREFASHGFHVLAGWHRTPPPLGPGITPVRLDVTDPSAWSNAAAELALHHHALHVLVHSAGLVRDDLLARARPDDWLALHDVHVRALATGTRAFLDSLRAGAPSHVVSISSHGARLAGAGRSAYASSKAAAIGLAQSLARELAPDGIRVNTVCPGVLDSPMVRTLSEAARRELLAPSLLGGPSDPAEVARFIHALTQLTQVSGQIFHLDSRPLPWA